MVSCAASAKALRNSSGVDGVYVTTGDRLIFRRVPPPTAAALEKLVRGISARVGRALERQGLLVGALEESFLTVDAPDGTGFDDLLGHSITYRIALGALPKVGRLLPCRRCRQRQNPSTAS